MEPCYEYLGCKKHDCVMFQIKNNTPCWQVEGTLCNHIGIETVREEIEGNKEKVCEISGCIYYQLARTKGMVSGSLARP